jgi:hypothetical protein
MRGTGGADKQACHSGTAGFAKSHPEIDQWLFAKRNRKPQMPGFA